MQQVVRWEHFRPGNAFLTLIVAQQTVAILLFCGGLLLSLMSSVVLSERLDQVGHRFRLPPGLIGLVTALGADSPEIASAAAAIIGGQHDLGRGVIFWSNIFNLAMLLGLSAVVAGRVAMRGVREPHERERPRYRRLLGPCAWFVRCTDISDFSIVISVVCRLSDTTTHGPS